MLVWIGGFFVRHSSEFVWIGGHVETLDFAHALITRLGRAFFSSATQYSSWSIQWGGGPPSAWHSDCVAPCWFLSFPRIYTISTMHGLRCAFLATVSCRSRRRLLIWFCPFSQRARACHQATPSYTEATTAPSRRTLEALDTTSCVALASAAVGTRQASRDRTSCAVEEEGETRK